MVWPFCDLKVAISHQIWPKNYTTSWRFYIREETALPKVFIHVSNEIFDFIVVKNGKLLICNSFLYKTPEDFIYYILFCFEQLKLNPDEVKTVLLGSINEEDDTYKILYKYVRNIEFLKSKQKIKLSESDNTHHNFLLKSII